MPSFLSLYHGPSIAAARLIAATADPALVADFASRLLAEQAELDPDPVLALLALGRQATLRAVVQEAATDANG
jgi:hypothetical protein